jgi:hypothetical protein
VRLEAVEAHDQLARREVELHDDGRIERVVRTVAIIDDLTRDGEPGIPAAGRLPSHNQDPS